MTVTTADATLWELTAQGDLFVSKDQSGVRDRQLLAGELGDVVLHMQFRAVNEDIDVTDIVITSSGSAATSVDRLELYKMGATTPFANATIGGGGNDDVGKKNTGLESAVVNSF